MNRLVLSSIIFFVSEPIRSAEVDFTKDIRPILVARCTACHGGLQQKGNLRLDTAQLLHKGGKHGTPLSIANPKDSYLLERLRDIDDSSRMPPQGKPLTPEQIQLITDWIAQGAKIPTKETPEQDPKDHWAFQPVSRPTVPPAKNASNPIDAFLLSEQGRLGLVHQSPTDRATLLRRVTLDLTGLPPTREETHAFLADQSPNAYERVIDRLLDSPAYGERWARHWMDIWRYSDWYGRRNVPDVLNSYGMIWRWRDWIVRSLNEDRGYDWMVRMMLAADEIDPTNDANLVATGFLVRNFFRWNYNNWMRDNVEHTGKAFLGQTLNCCHCHDHKFDPITQEEYFKFRAIFEPLEIRHDRVPGEADPGVYPKYNYTASYKPITSGLVRIFDEKPEALTHFYAGGDERNKSKSKQPIPPGVPMQLGGKTFKIQPVQLPPQNWYPGTKSFIREEELNKRNHELSAAQSNLESAQKKLNDRQFPKSLLKVFGSKLQAWYQEVHQGLLIDAVRLAEAQVFTARADLHSLKQRIEADSIIHLGKNGDHKLAAESASFAEREHQLAIASLTLVQAEIACRTASRNLLKPDKIAPLSTALTQAIAKRDALNQALKTPSAIYTPLSPQYIKTSSGRRTALANWITSSENPLTARVAVNHLWGWHFGRPIVETSSNFGRQGKLPTHPKLLDWLATELVNSGWKMKHIHRLIVTSQIYQQRSGERDIPEATKKADPDNLFLWKFPTQRLEAEVLRDCLLASAGELNRTMGGPEIPHEEGMKQNRRSLYFSHHGESRMAFLELFDTANPVDCYRRSSSVIPQQALAMTNSELVQRQATMLANKLSKTTKSDSEFITVLFEQTLCRPPKPSEMEACMRYLNQALPKSDPSISGTAKTTLQIREQLVLVLFNHTDFVTIR